MRRTGKGRARRCCRRRTAWKEEHNMPNNSVVLHGLVKPDGTLELEDKVPLPAGKVRVTLEPVPYSQETDPFFVMLKKIRAARQQAGLQPRSTEEIEAE